MKIHKHTMINISDIKPYENNARIHTTEQVAQIKASIKEFGFTNPLLIDSNYNLIAGHGRLEAIQQLNNFDYKDNPITQAPAIIISDLSEAQRKALIIADNKIADNSYFATDLLKQELQELESLIDLDILGFSDDEISEILNFDDMLETESQDKLNTDKDKYVNVGDKIHYDIKGDKPSIKELAGLETYQKMLEMINNNKHLKEHTELKEFLKLTATRFIEFEFDKIAEYYAHCDKETQAIFETLLLVIIDFNDAIKNGILKLDKSIEDLIC